MPRPDLPTMDLTHAMTFATKVRGIRVTPQAKSVLTRYRAELRRAEKFTVDDDAVRLACQLSHERTRLRSFAFLARLPFDVCWLEYNLQVKVKEFNRLNGKQPPDWADVPERVGTLLYKDDPSSDSPRWVATQFLQHNGEIVPAPLSFVFDPEGSDYDPVRGSKRWQAPTLSLMPGFPRLRVKTTLSDVEGELAEQAKTNPRLRPLLKELRTHPDELRATPLPVEDEADAECLLFGFGGMAYGQGGFRSDDWIINRIAAFADPYWHAQCAGMTRAKYYQSLLIEVREEMGHLRWLMTLLASINHLPKEVKPVETRIGRRTVGANILPYFQHRTISIKLPKDDRVVWARKHLASALRNAPRAWHRVSGHWRIVERGKAPKYICRHLPTMVEQGLGMCERCELMIRWIPDHHRGDPMIGVVEHTYAVTAK